MILIIYNENKKKENFLGIENLNYNQRVLL